MASGIVWGNFSAPIVKFVPASRPKDLPQPNWRRRSLGGPEVRGSRLIGAIVGQMDYPACLTSPVAGNTYCGLGISQTWSDLALWEAFLDGHRLGSILELGTWRGGMALFLAHQGRARDLAVVSVDLHHGGVDRPDLIASAGCRLVAMDLLGPGAPERMAALLAELPGPVVLFCDNGNKPAEWRSFVPLLASGDFAAVHDWGTEFTESDLNPTLPMLMQSPCEQAGSMTRFFGVP